MKVDNKTPSAVRNTVASVKVITCAGKSYLYNGGVAASKENPQSCLFNLKLTKGTFIHSFFAPKFVADGIFRVFPKRECEAGEIYKARTGNNGKCGDHAGLALNKKQLYLN